MQDGFKNKVEGSIDKAKGEIKDQYGKLTGQKDKEAEGKFDKAKGSAKNVVSEVKDSFKNNNK